jgi:drug/metabolite transporter (DMT)-like permease
MLVVGLGVVFVGYSLTYYGISQMKGGNWGLLDLVVPSKWTPQTALIPRDGQ